MSTETPILTPKQAMAKVVADRWELEMKAARAELQAESAQDPWTLADKEGKPLITPMDNKTIKNAIMKRLPEARKIYLVKDKLKSDTMAIVVLCQLLHETAILVEDSANIFMRHRDLMNIVDNMWLELKARKRMRKTNKLPGDFFRSERMQELGRFV